MELEKKLKQYIHDLIKKDLDERVHISSEQDTRLALMELFRPRNTWICEQHKRDDLTY